MDLGIAFPSNTKIDINGFDNVIDVNNGTGWSSDVLVGYDFGILRTEAELSYQSWGLDTLTVTGPGIPVVNPLSTPYVTGTFADADGKSHIITAMANALLDFGGNGNFGFYAGVGAGYAWVNTHLETTKNAASFLDNSDGNWAWQFIAGARFPVSDSMSVQ